MLTETKILSLIARHLEVDSTRVTPEVDFRGEPNLALDSLDKVEIVMAIEDEFKIEVPDADLAAFRTIGDLIGYVDKRIEPSGEPSANLRKAD